MLWLRPDGISSGPPSPSTRLIYFGEFGTHWISRARLNGSHLQFHFLNVRSETGALTVTGDHIYWAHLEGQGIGRAGLTGGEVSPHFIPSASAGCGLVAADGFLYWGVLDGEVGRAAVSGAGATNAFIPNSSPTLRRGTPGCGIAVG